METFAFLQTAIRAPRRPSNAHADPNPAPDVRSPSLLANLSNPRLLLASGLSMLSMLATTPAQATVRSGHAGNAVSAVQTALQGNNNASPTALPNRVELPNFSLQNNAFSFTNAELTTGISQNDALFPDTWDADQDAGSAYWSQTLETLFGTEVCVNGDTDPCRLSTPARRWVELQINLLEDGVCDGIAAASLYLWNETLRPANQPFPYRNTDNQLNLQSYLAAEIDSNDHALQTYASELFLLQSIDEVYEQSAQTRSNRPSQILQQLTTAIATVQADPTQFSQLYTLGIYQLDPKDHSLTGGHTLTPFAVTPMSDGSSRVSVYDSNFPQRSDLFVEFHGDQWRYTPPPGNQPMNLPFQGDATTGNLELTQMVWRDPSSPQHTYTCPFCNQSTEGDFELFLDGIGDLEVNQIRPDGAEQSIAGLVPSRGGLGKDIPPSYDLVAGEYEVNSELAGDESLAMIGSDFIVGFTQEDPSAPSQPITVYLLNSAAGNPTAVFEATADMTTIPTIFISVSDGANSYDLEIRDVQLNSGNSLVVALDKANQRIYFGDNNPDGSEYQLNARFIRAGYAETDDADDENGYEIDIGEVPMDPTEVGYFAYGEWTPELENAFLDYPPEQDLPDEIADSFPLYFADWQDIATSDSTTLLNAFTDAQSFSFQSLRAERKDIRNGPRKTW